ncbi:tail sheath protein [Mycobacterium phage Phrappuccino]|uniref:Tail sheath protein n=1 Tax=Mycobacterium phage Phrappuccino TaxID=2591223 RepID=A0A514DDS2_9CAUD|nr:tail sheath [Mycobacterium phage Phrappuccino]QDH91748.1 tail sheath protein [Mycobacterium phage Phrappuccino]QIQ63190.1 tail sheath protein [Mycobacterium phage Settecandela]
MAVSSAANFGSRYLPPGVYTRIVDGPQLAVNSSMPTAVGLFGTAVGFRTWLETLQINPDTDAETPAINRTLAKQGIDVETLVVRNPTSGQTYVEGTDYTVEHIGGTINTPNATYAIARVIDGGHIDPGTEVQISYRYTDPKYFDPYIFYDYEDVRAAYGDPYNTATGEIQSELTLHAKFAFANGAYQVVCVAVDPATPGSPTTGEYADALAKLSDQPQVAVVSSCSGAVPLHALVQQHVRVQSDNRFERRAILGMDGSVTPIASAQRILNAQALTDRRVALVSPSSFVTYSEELNNEVTLGGQYMATCLAAMTVAMDFAQPLTHKRITGWKAIGELQPEGEKNLESQNGLMVVEQTRQQIIRVRHGVTTDPTDLISREWNVTGQTDALTFRIRDYLEAANLIGQPIYGYTLINVKSSAQSALESLKRDGLLVDYHGLKARQLLTNPDVISVSFTWLPAFPLNYIVVEFGISLTNGEVSIGDTANLNNFGSPSATNSFGGPGNTLQSI